MKGLSEKRSNSVFKEEQLDSRSNVITSPNTRSFCNVIADTETPIPVTLNKKLRNNNNKSGNSMVRAKSAVRISGTR